MALRMKPADTLGIAVFLVPAFLIFAASPALQGGRVAQAAAGQSRDHRVRGPSSAEAAVSPLLAQIWSSGFFRRNEAVRQEILNNEYAFFDRGRPLAGQEKGGLGCYSRGVGGKDTIFLRKDIFAHFDVRIEGVFDHHDLRPKILTVLVHEICHDLWTNILDERERMAFSREGREFVSDYRRALTADEKQFFLRWIGDDTPDLGRVQFFASLDGMLKTYPPSVRCGQELFAWLAERFFSTNAKIPKPLRKYYAGILTGLLIGEPKAPN
jgi:hypothetical protein